MFMMLMLLFFIEPEISESVHQTVGESGGEDSEDEWNYVKIDKKIPDGLAAVEETLETVESPIVETKEIVAEEVIPVISRC